MDIDINDKTIEAVADILAYQQVKRNNPDADSVIWGYRAFDQDQRDFLIEKQKDNARDILMALQNVVEPASNYCGYIVSEFHGLVHVDPATGKIHQDDHICNQQCHDLKARAAAEYQEDIVKHNKISWWGKLSESGRVQVTPKGKVKVTEAESLRTIAEEKRNISAKREGERTKMSLGVPTKPTDMAAMWHASSRREHTNKEGVWLQYRDIVIGPFPNRSEASWYDGQLQDVIMGWGRKDLFAGRIFPFGDAWFVERWATNDGPFMSLGAAVDHRQKLYDEYGKDSDELWKVRAEHQMASIRRITRKISPDEKE